MAWMVFLEQMAPRASQESVEQTVFLERLGLRVMTGLRDRGDPQGREEKLGYLGREALTEQEETEGFLESGAQTDLSDLREQRETRAT